MRATTLLIALLVTPLSYGQVSEPAEPVPTEEIQPVYEKAELTIENADLEVGGRGIAHLVGIRLIDFSDTKNVKIAIYPVKGVSLLPSVNPLSKAVDILIFPDEPGKYHIVFAMSRNAQLIYLEASLNVKERKHAERSNPGALPAPVLPGDAPE